MAFPPVQDQATLAEYLSRVTPAEVATTLDAFGYAPIHVRGNG